MLKIQRPLSFGGTDLTTRTCVSLQLRLCCTDQQKQRKRLGASGRCLSEQQSLVLSSVQVLRSSLAPRNSRYLKALPSSKAQMIKSVLGGTTSKMPKGPILSSTICVKSTPCGTCRNRNNMDLPRSIDTSFDPRKRHRTVSATGTVTNVLLSLTLKSFVWVT